MRLHGDLLRRPPDRRGPKTRVLSVAVLAFFFALALWPCCEVMAGSLLQERHDAGAMHGTDGAPGPCAWMDASDVALPELAPVARTTSGVAAPAVLGIDRIGLIREPVLPHAGSSRGPPRPLYLGLLRLLL